MLVGRLYADASDQRYCRSVGFRDSTSSDTVERPDTGDTAEPACVVVVGAAGFVGEVPMVDNMSVCVCVWGASTG